MSRSSTTNIDSKNNNLVSKRSSFAPAQCPLAIACQTMLQAPYVKEGIVTIKLSRWFTNIVGDIEAVENYAKTSLR